MSTAPSAPSAPAPPAVKPRGELIVAALVAAVGAVLLVRTATMDVPGTAAYLGPQFFPYVVGALLVVLSALLVVQHVRSAPPAAGGTDAAGGAADTDGTGDTGAAGDAGEAAGSDAGSDAAAAPPMSWKPFGIVALTLVLHVLLLQPLGWLIAGAGLFFGTSYALGGRRVLRDIGVSFVMSAAAQVAFSTGLGIALPAGILGGVV